MRAATFFLGRSVIVFSSVEFALLFLPLFLVVYVLIPWGRNFTLLVFSILFYFFGEGFYVVVMLGSIAMNYVFGLCLGVEGRYRRIILWISVAANLLLLIYYKYTGFLLADILNLPDHTWSDSIHLPLGISFFTFQSVSYVVDVYLGRARVETSPLRLGAYIAMFPQLVAGPIVRFSSVATALRRRTVRAFDIYRGALFFAGGLGQKVLIADTVSTIADGVYGTSPELLTSGAAWLGGLAYSIQIFFDFSGYSCMAIGLGFMLGFRFPRNFNYPYISESVTDFWRRWHMSLSSWFRDYLYIPLGGNRHGVISTYRNLFIVFLMTGVWHGAAWNFVVWGLYHGLALIVERLGLGSLLKRLPPALRVAYTLAIVYFGWVLFRATDLGQATEMLGRMFAFSENGLTAASFLNGENLFALILGVILSAPVVKYAAPGVFQYPEIEGKGQFGSRIKVGVGVLLAVIVLTLSVAKILSGAHSPFIYFRF